MAARNTNFEPNETNHKRICRHLIYVLPRKIDKRRYEILTNNSIKKNLPVVKSFSDDVTHVVSACDTADEVLKALQFESQQQIDLNILKTTWLSSSILSGTIQPILNEHIIPYAKKVEDNVIHECDPSQKEIPSFACQRKSPLKSCNEQIVDALLILEENGEFHDDHTRALAYRSGASVIKSMEFKITSLNQIRKAPHIGAHCKQIIEDIIEHGFSREVENISESDWYKKMKIFTSIFGVGTTIGKRWIDCGLNSIDDAIKFPDILLRSDERVYLGLAFYKELNTPVSKEEAENFTSVVAEYVRNILPSAAVDLVGGFIRGKPNGHDIDILITPKNDSEGIGLLPKLLDTLQKKGHLLHGRWQANGFKEDMLSDDNIIGTQYKSTLDVFEKWIGIIKYYPSSDYANFQEKPSSPNASETWSLERALKVAARSDRDWVVRRVDLILVPQAQYYYALLGWTGSRHFNRSMRLYADKQSKKLSSHGLYDKVKKQSLPAKSEEEIFQHLGLKYIDPKFRNS